MKFSVQLGVGEVVTLFFLVAVVGWPTVSTWRSWVRATRGRGRITHKGLLVSGHTAMGVRPAWTNAEFSTVQEIDNPPTFLTSNSNARYGRSGVDGLMEISVTRGRTLNGLSATVASRIGGRTTSRGNMAGLIGKHTAVGRTVKHPIADRTQDQTATIAELKDAVSRDK